MAKRKNRVSNNPRRGGRLFGVWILLVISVLVVSAMAAYVKYTPADRIPSEQRLDAPPSKPDEVRAFQPRYDGDDLKFDSKAVKVSPGVDQKVFAVNAFLKDSGVAPADAKLVSCSVKDRIAYLEFNDAFQQTYGTEDEQTLLKGILTVMGQFPDVREVQFLVGGRPLETLGNIDLTTPQPVRHVGG